MSEPIPVLNSPVRLAASKAFYTDIKQKTEMQREEGKLTKYVDNLHKKLDYAKWKQSLVLQYNYLPMKRITQKVENEKVNYIKKIAQEQKNCAKILSGKQITVQLQLFRQFSKKLNQKLQDFQVKIAQQKINNNIFLQQVSQKKMRLKQRMRDNMNVIRSALQENGVKNKADIISLVRSKSTKQRFNALSSYLGTDSNYQLTQRINTQRKISSQHTKRQLLRTNDMFFRECLDKLIISIQSMKSSEDIQSGIYLDVMGKHDKKNFKTDSRYVKSKISQTIHSKFGSSHVQQVNNTKNKANFQMDWQTFQQLNWKQIMGILMVKDKNCDKTKKLLRFK